MRVLHVSDVHVSVPFSALPWREMWNKRLLGAANLALRRGRHFAHAKQKLMALAELAQREQVDAVICTGDYTALGTEPELVEARRAIDPLTKRPGGFATVPGNHDIYMPDALRDRRFQRHFGDLLQSDLPEACSDGLFPIVRLLGDRAAVIAVNSARPNPQPWRSSGAIPESQLRALPGLCADPRLRDRFLFVITHYAPRRSDGKPDRPSHGLTNADALLQACRGVRRGALLHGHIHRRFQLALPDLPIKIFGAGSTTCEGSEGLWLFELQGDQARAIPGGYRDGRYALEPEHVIPL